MLIKTHLNKKLIIATSVISGLFAVVVFAATTANITFPIAELGNCQDKDSCRQYCNDPNNIPACQAFAQAHNLTPKTNNGDSGTASNLAQAIKNGGGPGGCDSFDSCRTYCQNPDNQSECKTFAQAHGLTKPPQTPSADSKINSTLQETTGPGGCSSKDTCRQYCSDPSHQDECLSFAKEHNLIPKDQSDKVAKFLSLVQSGQTPGGCKTTQDCHQYCSDSSHSTECADFLLKLGVVTKDQAGDFKETKGEGPGGCKSREECSAFCNDAANHDTCLKFAQEHNLIPKKTIEDIKSNSDQVKQKLQNLPPQTLNCLKQKLGDDTITKLENGQLLPSGTTTSKAKECFQGQSGGQTNGQGNPQGSPHPMKLPPQILSCLKENLSETNYSFFSGDTPPNTKDLSPDVIAVVKKCFEQSQGLNGSPMPGQGMSEHGMPGTSPGEAMPTRPACQPYYYWDGSQCSSYADKCVQLGGQWNSDNHTCVRPSVSPGTNMPHQEGPGTFTGTPPPKPPLPPPPSPTSSNPFLRLGAAIVNFIIGSHPMVVAR